MLDLNERGDPFLYIPAVHDTDRRFKHLKVFATGGMVAATGLDWNPCLAVPAESSFKA